MQLAAHPRGARRVARTWRAGAHRVATVTVAHRSKRKSCASLCKELALEIGEKECEVVRYAKRRSSIRKERRERPSHFAPKLGSAKRNLNEITHTPTETLLVIEAILTRRMPPSAEY
jgi:hypothetical protein